MNLQTLEKYRDSDLEAALADLIIPGESLAAGMIGKVAFTVTADNEGGWMVSLTKQSGVVTQRDARQFFDLIGEDHRQNEDSDLRPNFRRWFKE